MCHYSHFCLKCFCQYYSVHCTKSILQLTFDCIYYHLEHNFDWTIWLWNLRHAASYCSLARGSGLLEHSSYCQDTPRTSLAKLERIQATSSLLVQLRGHVLLRILSRLHFPILEFRFHPVLSSHACHWFESSCSYECIRWRDQQRRIGNFQSFF